MGDHEHHGNNSFSEDNEDNHGNWSDHDDHDMMGGGVSNKTTDGNLTESLQSVLSSDARSLTRPVALLHGIGVLLMYSVVA